ncbi:hypothetical protein M405DRAFT_754566 [Rhizopogon salebrosus TDB-379]|nr:hypothetical protein M405DRAFT_754566 [Rhizopogon salebrosus TDB-379]
MTRCPGPFTPLSSAAIVPITDKVLSIPQLTNSVDAHVNSDTPHACRLVGLSMTEQDTLHTLAEGKGITKYEYTGLLEVCGSCQRMFVATALRAHIVTCSKS